jgi:hypothetical protein
MVHLEKKAGYHKTGARVIPLNKKRMEGVFYCIAFDTVRIFSQ